MAEQLEPAMAAALQGYDAGEIVELFIVDATKIGFEVLGFSAAPIENASAERVPLVFDGQAFPPFPLQSEGWEWSGTGPAPTPSMTFGFTREDDDAESAAALLLAALVLYDDFIGSRVTRLRTLRQFLDDGDDPNPAAVISREIYVIEQKTAETPTSVSFRLRAEIDLEGVELPRRTARDRCQWVYRVADPEGVDGFSYADATCPYAGEAMFNLAGEAVSAPALDRCAKNLSDCKLRFGATATLPFGGFPGIGRTRI